MNGLAPVTTRLIEKISQDAGAWLFQWEQILHVPDLAASTAGRLRMYQDSRGLNERGLGRFLICDEIGDKSACVPEVEDGTRLSKRAEGYERQLKPEQKQI